MYVRPQRTLAVGVSDGGNFNIHVISNIKDYTLVLFAKEQVLHTLDNETNYVLYSCSFNAKNHKEAEKIAMKKVEEYLKERKKNLN